MLDFVREKFGNDVADKLADLNPDLGFGPEKDAEEIYNRIPEEVEAYYFSDPSPYDADAWTAGFIAQRALENLEEDLWVFYNN
jgi:hypothetical protein